MTNPSAHGDIPLKRKILFFGIVVFVTAMIPFTLAEAYLRVTEKNIRLLSLTGREKNQNPMAEWADLDAFCAYRGRPGVYRDRKSHGVKTVNSFGFISTPEITPKKEPGTLRIAFLGGSSTAGTGHLLADEETWPWQVVEILKKEYGGKVDFINGALGGYSSFESYGRFWSRIRFFSPDVVVVYHGWNEMYYFKQVDRIVKRRTLADGSWSFDSTQKEVVAYEPLLIDHVIRYSQVLSRIRLRFTRLTGGEAGAAQPQVKQAPPAKAKAEPKTRPDEARAEVAAAQTPPAKAKAEPKTRPNLPPPAYDPRALEIWRTQLALLREAARIFDVELLVAKQATLIVPDLPAAQRERCRYDYHGFGHDHHVRAFTDLYRVIDEEIPAGQILDATSLSGRPELFYDHVHLTKDGAHELAEMMAQALLNHLRQR